MIKNDNKSITYTPFNKTASIKTYNNNTVNYYYNPNKVAYGNQYDEQHKANDRLLGYVVASIPAGRIASKAYPYVKKGFKPVIDWGYKNPETIGNVTNFISGYYTKTPSANKYQRYGRATKIIENILVH